MRSCLSKNYFDENNRYLSMNWLYNLDLYQLFEIQPSGLVDQF